MIDKAEQRRRAAELSQQLAAQGQQAPKLTYPVSKPKPPVKFGCQAAQEAKRFTPQPKAKAVKQRWDAIGQELKVNDIVVTTVDGIVSILRKGRITRFTKDRIEIEVSFANGSYKKVMKYGEAVVKVS